MHMPLIMKILVKHFSDGHVQVSLSVLCRQPLELNLKYLPQFFRYTLPKLYFVCSLARTFTLPCTVSSSNSQEQATHTHIVTPIVENVLYVFELSRVWFGLEASWPLHLLRLVQLLWLPHFILLWRLFSFSFLHCFSFHTLQMSM